MSLSPRPVIMPQACGVRGARPTSDEAHERAGGLEPPAVRGRSECGGSTGAASGAGTSEAVKFRPAACGAAEQAALLQVGPRRVLEPREI